MNPFQHHVVNSPRFLDALLGDFGSKQDEMSGLGHVALICMATFVTIEHRTTVPLVRLAVLRDRALAAGLVSMGLVSTVMMRVRQPEKVAH